MENDVSSPEAPTVAPPLPTAEVASQAVQPPTMPEASFGPGQTDVRPTPNDPQTTPFSEQPPQPLPAQQTPSQPGQQPTQLSQPVPQQQGQLQQGRPQWKNRGRNRNNRFGRNGGQQGFKPQQQQPQPTVPRNPDLPEYKLADIHSWDNAEIVAKMWPDANAEDLGAMKRHEIIFNAIRSYLSRGGAVMASG